MSTYSVLTGNTVIVVSFVVLFFDFCCFNVCLWFILGLMLDLSGAFFHVQETVKEMGRALQLIDNSLHMKTQILSQVPKSNQIV